MDRRSLAPDGLRQSTEAESLSDELIQLAEASTRGSFLLTVGNLASTVISALGVFIIAGLLQPELYGAYSLSLSIPAIFLLFVNMGVNEGLTWFSANLHSNGRTGELARLIRAGIVYNIIVGFFFFLLCFVFSDYLAAYMIARPEYGGYVRLASFSILFQVLFSSASAVFTGFYRMEFSALSSITAAILKILISPVLIVLGLGILGAIAGVVVSFSVASALGISIVFIKIYRKLRRTDLTSHFLADAKKLLKYGFPLYAATIISGLYLQLQSVILANFTSDIEVGFFRAALNFVALVQVFSIAFSLSVFPAFARLERRSDRLKSFFSSSVKYTSLILLPLVFIIMAFSREIVLIVYGPSYSSTPFYLILIMLQFLLAGLGGVVLASFFNGVGATGMNLRTSLIHIAVFIPLTLLLVNLYGVNGLIIGSLVATSCSTIYGVFAVYKTFGAKPEWGTIVKIYLASSISLALVLVFSHLFAYSNAIFRLSVGASVFILIYLTLLPMLRILSLQDLSNLEQAMRKTKALAHIIKPVFSYERKLVRLVEKDA